MWLSFEQVANLGKTDRWVRQQAASGALTTRGTGQRGRNGKEIREILLESLPHEMQLIWIQQNKPVDLETEDPERSLTNDCIDSERRLTEALMRYETNVRDAMRDEALRLQSIVNRYKSINPRRQKNAQGKHEFVPEVLLLCEEARCTNELVLRHEPRRADAPSPFSLDNWMRSSETNGLAAFLRKPAETRKKQDNRKAKISAEAVEWTNKNWRNFPSPRHFYKEIKKKARSKKWTIPSEAWFRRKYESLPKIVETVVFGNDKDYQSKFAPYVPRTVEDLEALQVLCGDHSIRDITVVDKDGKLMRPWLTLWLDLRTYLIWGWYLDVTPSSKTIGLAYANGVKTFGAQPISQPDIDFYSYLYTDQGKDYKAKTFDGKDLVFKQAAKIEGGLEMICTQRRVGFFDETGIKHLTARGYNAKEKPVERVHADISRWEENTFLRDGYCGRDAKHRPEAWTEAYKRHKALQKKFANNIPALLETTPFFTLEEYREALAGWIHEFNTSEHTRTVLSGRKIVPMDELERLYTRVNISEEALALLLMKTTKKKVTKNGVQLFQSNWWFLHEEMSEHKGSDIEIRYSDDDYSHVWAICPATETKPMRIVQADLVTPSSILKPNKQTMGLISTQKNHERKLIRDFTLLNQSVLRGESLEERVAALLQPEELEIEEIEIKKVASGGGGTIHQLTRMDAPKIGAFNKGISAEKVERAEVVDIFRKSEKTTIKEEWED